MPRMCFVCFICWIVLPDLLSAMGILSSQRTWTGRTLPPQTWVKIKPACWRSGIIEKLPDLMELIEPKEWELNPYSTKRTKEMVLLLGCVDNNKTRQLCHQAFHQSEELIYIDSGNGKYTGQVVCGVRRNGRTIRKSIGGVHPEMLKDTDLFPSEISCAEAAQEDPQSIVANVTAATAVLIMVYNILTHGENNALQTDFSTRTIRMQTVLEKQTRRRAA